MPPTLDQLFVTAARRIRRFARERDGAIPGAYHVPRTVLEWRVASEEWRNPELDGRALVIARISHLDERSSLGRFASLVSHQVSDGAEGREHGAQLGLA